ncbi:MAG: dTMP kinase [Pseudomonadota bacterium]|nr:dTMP kinase [Pseudomonadota bacterium]
MKGKFITVEGIEGVGKTTSVRVIADFLHQYADVEVIATREPGGTAFCERLRELFTREYHEPIHVDTEILLLFASRNQHVNQLILPALERGAWVICDRFTDATYAYQNASGIDFERIQQIQTWLPNIPKPDLTFLLDAPVSLCIKRLNTRSTKDRIESRDADYFSRVRTNYLNIAAQEEDRFCIINGSNPIDDVHASIEARLSMLLENHANC